ncbi:unnamed protein product [Merluccius merluccius]
MTSLLRSDKNEKGCLREELKQAGVFPGPVTQVTSLCTRLTEGEANELCSSVGVLAAKGINFEAVTMPLPSDPSVAAGKATELNSSACGKKSTLLKLFQMLCATRCMTQCTVAFGTLNTLDTTWSLCRLFMARLDRRKSCHSSAPSLRHMRRMGT